MRSGPITKFLLIGGAVGVVVPVFLTMCLFGTTVQKFVANPEPTAGYWSGAPTPVSTPVPSAVQVWTKTTISAAGGAVFLLWSVLGAFGGEALAVRRGKEWDAPRNAWLGAVAGSLIFVVIAVCGFLR
jgi:hypothetical protein